MSADNTSIGDPLDMTERIPITAVKIVTDESGKILGIENLESGQSIPAENISDESEFVCEERSFAPYDLNEQAVGEQSGGFFAGLKENFAPVIAFGENVLAGAKELCAANERKAKEEAVAQNMKKGAQECMVKKDAPANKETDKSGDGIVNEENARTTPNNSNSVLQAAIKKDGAELSGNEADGAWQAGREAIRTEALRSSGGEAAIGEAEVARSKKEEMSARTATVLPDLAVAEDRSAVEQVIRDNVEQAEKITEEKMALEVADAKTLQEKVDNDNAISKEMQRNDLASEDERPGHPLDANSVPTQDAPAPNMKMSGDLGEFWFPLSLSPFASNDSSSVAYQFGPKISFAARVEESFPAIVHNFIGCFYLQLHKDALERGTTPAGNMQVMTNDGGERVQPLREKEGGNNHSDQGGSSNQGQDRGEEKAENNFPESA